MSKTLQQLDSGMAVSAAAKDRAISHLVMRGSQSPDATRNDASFSPGAPEDDNPTAFLRQRKIQRQAQRDRYDKARRVAEALHWAIVKRCVQERELQPHQEAEREDLINRMITLNIRKKRVIAFAARINPNN